MKGCTVEHLSFTR